MKYKKNAVKEHLSQYKRDVLQISEEGMWANNKIRYPHILPMSMKSRNLIDKDYYDQLIETTINSGNKLHSGFHHLNSSQALAFNLFVPLIIENKLDLLLAELGIEDSNVDAKFEYIDDPIEKTNFDFYLEGNAHKVFFEIKYTEDRFGSAKRDNKHLAKYNNIYKDELNKICDISAEQFFKNYQLWRNIYYSQKGIVVFVFPRFREDLTKEVESAIKEITQKDMVKVLFIDDLVDVLIKSGNESMKNHYIEFTKKYLNIKNI